MDACASLKRGGVNFVCLIAGDGPERKGLQRQIARLGLSREVKLLGHLDPDSLAALYRTVDLVVLASRSEGIPLTLMEAMSWERLVLAPNITGIPELVVPGQTGFLYTAGSLTDFVTQIENIRSLFPHLSSIQKAGREHVNAHFNQTTNLGNFTAALLSQIPSGGQNCHAHPVLQQV